MHESDDAFELGLRSLEDLLVELAGDMHTAEASGEPADQATLNDADDALSLATRLLAAWTLGRRASLATPASVVLERTPVVPNAPGAHYSPDLAAKLPAMLHVALDTLLEDDTIDREPHGNVAVVARMLAAIASALEEERADCGSHGAALAGLTTCCSGHRRVSLATDLPADIRSQLGIEGIKILG